MTILGERRNGRLSLLVAAATGLFTVALYWLYRQPAVSPTVWNDLAAAAGLRPTESALDGLVRGFYALLFRFLSPADVFQTVRVCGWCAAGLVAFLSYSTLEGFSGPLVGWMSRTVRGRAMVACSLVTVTLMLVCSDAVWYSLQSFGAEGLHILLAAFGLWLLQGLVRTHRRHYAILSVFVWTVLAVEAPLGVAGILAVAALVIWITAQPVVSEALLKLNNPLVRIALRRGLAGIVVVTYVVLVWAECRFLRTFSGGEGLGAAPVSYFSYMVEWGRRFTADFAWQSFLLAVASVIGPALAARTMRDRSLDSDDFVPDAVIVVFLVCGCLAWFQLGGVRALRFETWFGRGLVQSALAGAALAFISGLTLLWALLVLGTAVFLKRPRRIALLRYPDAMETEAGKDALTQMERLRRVVLPMIACVPVLMAVLVVVLRNDSTLHGMLDVVDGYLRETVTECEGLTRVFTDGQLDAGLELEAFRRGKSLYAVSLMPSLRARDTTLRMRGLTEADDRKAASTGAIDLLRTWVNDTPERLNDAAVQMAFELWRKQPKPLVCLGTVALPPDSVARPDVESCVAQARALGDRIVALYESGRPDVAGTSLMRSLFRVVQWRLSRLAGMRADAAGKENWTEEADREQVMADRLHELNSEYAEIERRRAEAASRGPILTPREGLRFGLDRADFKLAARFASSVLLRDPTDAQANFAVGMDYFLSGEFSRAEPHLRTCLAGRPHDPAVLNNLAVVELRLCRYDEAEHFAREALDRMPDSPQIKRTLEAISMARGRYRKETP